MNKGSRPRNLRRLSLGLLAAGLALAGTGVLEQHLRMERDAAEYDQWRVALKHTPAAVTAEATPAPPERQQHRCAVPAIPASGDGNAGSIRRAWSNRQSRSVLRCFRSRNRNAGKPDGIIV